MKIADRGEVLVPAVVFVLLLVVLRRLAISVYLVLSVLFSYFATLGVTVTIFGLTHWGEYDGLDWKVPIFLFTILVGTIILPQQVTIVPTYALFTRLGNLLDLCALALPNGFTKAGLPTSLQIVCRGYDESTALRIGWAYEQATEWHRRRPPIDG